ncbi:HNH endonuclease signature motif containing protein [Rhodococcus rhodochrous]|uniref:HNH endonuclease signature motif containing protein n=1 Tax=Rhodococcus rhodochrous TaxID=1829 RepID=UPI0017866DE6|nr:HNH endonuclease signature motif containing protein [Rhodococcus rhodochrous]
MTDFHRRSKSKDGRQNRCKPCAISTAKASVDRNRETVREYQKRYGQEKREQLAAYRSAYYRKNRTQLLARYKEKYRENRDVIRARTMAYYENNRERHAENARRWRAANPEREKLRYTRGNARRRAWKAANPHIPYTLEQLRQRLDYYGGLCWVCRSVGVEVDHVKPVSKGGPEMLANLRPICPPCNKRKTNKWPFRPTD